VSESQARETRLSLETKYSAIREQRRRRTAAPLFYAEPHRGQLEGINALRQPDVRGVLAIAGNRWGKTWWNAYIHWSHLLGYWPHLVPPELRVLTDTGYYPHRDQIPVEAWTRRPDDLPTAHPANILVVSGLTMDRGIGAIYWPKFEHACPAAARSRLSVRRGPGSTPIHCTDEYGSVSRFGSIEQGSMAFEGDAYSLVIFDEPPSRAVFTACWRGLIDQFGRFVMGFTPLGAHAPWVYKEFVSGQRRDVRAVSGAQSENPHLMEAALEGFEDTIEFSQEELEARKFGRWGFLTHRAFPTFDPAAHIIDPIKPPLHWPARLACDPANRRPFFFLWGAFDPVRRTWIIYDEWPRESYIKMRSSSYGIVDYVSMIVASEGDRRVRQRFIDPKFGPAEYSVQGRRLTSVIENFARYRMYFSPDIDGSGRIETGIVRVRDLLRTERDPHTGEVLVPPRLLICRNCRNLIEAMQNYSFVPPQARDDAVLDEKTLEAFKDPIDTLRYLVLPAEPTGFANGNVWGAARSDSLRVENNYDLADL